MLNWETGYAAAVSNGGGKKMKLGVLGGTFDPVHNGHLVIAEESMVRLGLDEVLFLPAGRPRFKDGDAVTPPISPADDRTGYPWEAIFRLIRRK